MGTGRLSIMYVLWFYFRVINPFKNIRPVHVVEEGAPIRTLRHTHSDRETDTDTQTNTAIETHSERQEPTHTLKHTQTVKNKTEHTHSQTES